MDHYVDIRLLPDPEFASTLLMNALFAKLHRALVDMRSQRIGISFPDLRMGPKGRRVGERLRLHGAVTDLDRLMGTEWLSGMHDHIATEGLLRVPELTEHCTVRRVQAKSNPERQRRRVARRQGISLEEATRLIPGDVGERLDLPFVTVNSRSTGQIFRLFIDQRSNVSRPESGNFNQYGLSSTATVPWF